MTVPGPYLSSACAAGFSCGWHLPRGRHRPGARRVRLGPGPRGRVPVRHGFL